MTEDVILTIIGRQMDLGEDAETEVIVPAAYYFRNGKHFLIYDEPDPESSAVTSNTIKIADQRVDVIRRGHQHVHMIFEKDKQINTCYHTAAGDIWMDVYTTDIHMEQRDRFIEVNIYYTLSMNEAFISECRATIRIQSRSDAQLGIAD